MKKNIAFAFISLIGQYDLLYICTAIPICRVQYGVPTMAECSGSNMKLIIARSSCHTHTHTHTSLSYYN